MGSKAKAIAGLLAATCVCSIIALILSVVNVKDVFLPPSTKVGSSGGAQLSLGCWLPVGGWICPSFRQALLFGTNMGPKPCTDWGGSG